MRDSGIIGEAYGRKIHAREVVAIDEAGDGLCWVRLTRFGDDWLLIRSDARNVSRALRKLPPDTGGRAVGSVPGGRTVSPLVYLALASRRWPSWSSSDCPPTRGPRGEQTVRARLADREDHHRGRKNHMLRTSATVPDTMSLAGKHEGSGRASDPARSFRPS